MFGILRKDNLDISKKKNQNFNLNEDGGRHLAYSGHCEAAFSTGAKVVRWRDIQNQNNISSVFSDAY